MWKALQHVNLGCGAVEAVIATRALWADVTRDSAGVSVEPRCLLDHRADACVVLLHSGALVVLRFHGGMIVGLFVVLATVVRARMVIQRGLVMGEKWRSEYASFAVLVCRRLAEAADASLVETGLSVKMSLVMRKRYAP